VTLKIFEEAFADGCGSCSMDCACGKQYYNPDPSWDFEEGELEALQNDPEAISLEWSAGHISFEGKTYVLDCDCWKQRAETIASFLDAHAGKIVEYLTLEKRRKQQEADYSPTVKDG